MRPFFVCDDAFQAVTGARCRLTRHGTPDRHAPDREKILIAKPAAIDHSLDCSLTPSWLRSRCWESHPMRVRRRLCFIPLGPRPTPSAQAPSVGDCSGSARPAPDSRRPVCGYRMSDHAYPIARYCSPKCLERETHVEPFQPEGAAAAASKFPGSRNSAQALALDQTNTPNASIVH